MANCPNCGLATERTQDWACRWCGYPLVSGSFPEILMTYQEAKAESLQGWAPVEVTEAAIHDEDGVVLSPGVVEFIPEMATVLAPLRVEPVTGFETTIGPEPVTEAEPVTEVVEELSETSEPVTWAEPVPSLGTFTITVEELRRACEEDIEAAEAAFAGSTLQITGEVGRIPPVEYNENPCLILTSAEPSTARNVLCVFERQHQAAVSQLAVGQLVMVQGKYDGCVMNILVTDCTLVS